MYESRYINSTPDHKVPGSFEVMFYALKCHFVTSMDVTSMSYIFHGGDKFSMEVNKWQLFLIFILNNNKHSNM